MLPLTELLHESENDVADSPPLTSGQSVVEIMKPNVP